MPMMVASKAVIDRVAFCTALVGFVGEAMLTVVTPLINQGSHSHVAMMLCLTKISLGLEGSYKCRRSIAEAAFMMMNVTKRSI